MNTNENTLNPTFIQDIRDMLQQARQKTYAAANFIMVETYWRVGRRIVEEEQKGQKRADYGAFLIRELSITLGAEFGKGFAIANLWNFRQFYLTFPSEEKLYTLRRELTWSHYRLIMRIDKLEARTWYLREAAEQQWSTRQLATQHQLQLLRAPAGNARPTTTSRARAHPSGRFCERPLCTRIPEPARDHMDCGKNTRSRAGRQPAALPARTWQRLLLCGPAISHQHRNQPFLCRSGVL